MGRSIGDFEAFSLNQFSFTPPYTDANEHFAVNFLIRHKPVWNIATVFN